MITWFLAFLIAATVALIATRLVIAVGISDSPDEARKLHKVVTPTSGGVGIAAGIFAGIAYACWQDALDLSPSVLVCLGVSLVGGILGLLDDIYVLGPKRKLAVMLIAVSAFVGFGARIDTLQFVPSIEISLGPILGSVGTVFWLLVLVNTINFMDGANGMAMGCAALGLLGLCGLVGLQPDSTANAIDVVVLSWIGFAACLGFLYWNALQGRIFAGDSGALFVGLFCGTLGVLAVMLGVNPLSVATCFLPMLVDAILTVILRVRRGENVMTAHSSHAYQRAIRHGATHLKTSSRYWSYTFFCEIGAVVAQQMGGIAPLVAFSVCLLLLCLVYAKACLDMRAKLTAEIVD